MNKINVIIPMAGLGKRFSDAGYTLPKPFLPLGKYSMIQSVIRNLAHPNFQFTLVVNREQLDINTLVFQLLEVNDNCTIVEVNHVPDGPADSSIFGVQLIEPDLPLIITNCDQIIEDFHAESFLEYCEFTKADGVVGVFHSISPKNSYVKLDANQNIELLKEKEVISSIATNGFHWWRKASDFSKSVEQMRLNNDTLNGEYYVAPSYNYMIKEGKRILPYHFNEHYPIGTPADYESYKEKICLK